jgi:hypothetical protein
LPSPGWAPSPGFGSPGRPSFWASVFSPGLPGWAEAIFARAAWRSSSATLGIRLSPISPSVFRSSASFSSVCGSNSGFFAASCTSFSPSSSSRSIRRDWASSAAACRSIRSRVSSAVSWSAGSERMSMFSLRRPISRSRTSLACARQRLSRSLTTSACSARSTT